MEGDYKEVIKRLKPLTDENVTIDEQKGDSDQKKSFRFIKYYLADAYLLDQQYENASTIYKELFFDESRYKRLHSLRYESKMEELRKSDDLDELLHFCKCSYNCYESVKVFDQKEAYQEGKDYLTSLLKEANSPASRFEILYCLGEMNYSAEDFATSVECFELAKECDNPISSFTLTSHDLMNLYFRMGRSCYFMYSVTNKEILYKAISAFEKAIENTDDTKELSTINYWLGGAYYALKRYKDAKDILYHSVSLAPENIPARENLCYTLCVLKNWEDCVAACEDLLKIKETDVIWYELGIAHLALQEYENAVFDYSRATELNASNSAYWVGRGDANYCLNRYEEALDDYNMAILYDPQKPKYFRNRARCLIALGRRAEAEEDNKRYEELLAASKGNT